MLFFILHGGEGNPRRKIRRGFIRAGSNSGFGVDKDRAILGRFRQGREAEQLPICRARKAFGEQGEQGAGEFARGVYLQFPESDGTGEQLAALIVFLLLFLDLGFSLFHFPDEFELLLAEGFELGF